MVDTLKDAGIQSVTRVHGEVAVLVSAYLHTHSSGPVLHALDLIGCGTAYGRIALSPVCCVHCAPSSLRLDHAHLGHALLDLTMIASTNSSPALLYSHVYCTVVPPPTPVNKTPSAL